MRRYFPHFPAVVLCTKLLFVELDRAQYGSLRFFLAVDAFNLNRSWFAFEGFVGLEKVLEFFDVVLVDVGEILDIFPAFVFNGYGDHFVVGFTTIYHVDHCDGAHRDKNARREREGGEDDDVERVAVVPECARSEAIIKRVGSSSVIGAIELDETRLFVDLILIVGAARNFDNCINFCRSVIAKRYIVPEIHTGECSRRYVF